MLWSAFGIWKSSSRRRMIQLVTQSQVESCRQRRKLNFSYNTSLHSVERSLEVLVLLFCCWHVLRISLYQCYEVHLTFENQVPRHQIIHSVTQNQVESCRQRRNWISYTLPPCTVLKNLSTKKIMAVTVDSKKFFC